MNKYSLVVMGLLLMASPFVVKELKKQNNPNQIVLQCTPRGRLPSSRREDRLMVDGYALTTTFKDPGFDPQSEYKSQVQNWYRDFWDAQIDFSISQIKDGRCYPVAPSLIETPLDGLGFTPKQYHKFRQFIDAKAVAKSPK